LDYYEDFLDLNYFGMLISSNVIFNSDDIIRKLEIYDLTSIGDSLISNIHIELSHLFSTLEYNDKYYKSDSVILYTLNNKIVLFYEKNSEMIFCDYIISWELIYTKTNDYVVCQHITAYYIKKYLKVSDYFSVFSRDLSVGKCEEKFKKYIIDVNI
jgi:hypothetical protein